MNKELYPVGALAVGLAAGLGLAAPLAHGDAKAPTISVDEIKDGMKGYGLTVFKGTEPEKFDVEVVGVLHNFRPSQALILVRTPHPRLNVTKNVKGMSGSPIYFNGRLAGAYAYSWASFQVEPVAGVTPIAPMLAEMHRPIPPGFWPLEGGAPLPSERAAAKRAELAPDERGSATAFRGAPGHYDLEAHAAEVARRLAPTAGDPARTLIPASTPLMLAGMSDRSLSFVRKMFGPLGLDPVQAGGGGGGSKADPNAPRHYVDGGAVGVQLARGDVSFMGLGTVTHVEGTRLCGFGHPMMEAGVTALPATIGRVHWIFASEQHSSKIGESARELGALVQDRQSSIVVDEIKVAPSFAVDVTIHGAQGVPKKDWHVDIAEERFMSASLTASIFGSIVDASVNERRDVSWRLDSKIKIRGHGTIQLEDFGIASGGMPDAGEFAHSRIARTVGEVLNNPWEQTHIERIEAVLTVDYTREVWRLRGVDLLDPIVDAGEVTRMRAHLIPFAGPELTKVLEVRMPLEAAGKDVDIDIVPGFEVAPDLPSPQSLSDLLSNITKTTPPKSLVLQFQHELQGVAFKGHVAEQLPSFALDALRPRTSDTGPDAVASHVTRVIPLERYVEGRDRVRVKVRPVLR